MTPRPFDFGEAPEAPADPVKGAAAPRALDFGDPHAESAPIVRDSPPKPLSFDDLPAVPALSNATVKTAPRALFDSEDHPAVRDALALARADYPVLYGHAEQRMAALFRRILPVKLALVTDWGEGALMEQASLLRPITELVLTFTQMAVPAQLEAALESTRAPAGMFGKLFRRATSPVEFKPALTTARAQLVQLMADSDVATRNLAASAHTLSLHAAVLAVVSTLAGDSPDVALLDALVQRRTLLQQAVRQAELSILQMGQVRQQAAELIGQVSSFLTVTLPAIEMAQAQGKP
ncbi:hypothetical protein AB2N08_20160 [Massilia aurea]|uniref:hypothetical protein n=1 Tax=Massilia aurea TaxID=373040 RepID=UPI0034629368